MKFLWPLLLALTLTSCITTRIALNENAKNVEIVTGEPNNNYCKYLGEIEGDAESMDISASQKNARNEFKNQTAELGGNIAKIDTNSAANAMDFTGRIRVVLNGRAFYCNKM